MTSGNSGVVSFILLQAVTKWIIKIKLDHANFLENFDRISEFSSKWILISGILSENTKSNYTERYDSLLKMKNHVISYIIVVCFITYLNSIKGSDLGSK